MLVEVAWVRSTRKRARARERTVEEAIALS